jgi:hypothetical protein
MSKALLTDGRQRKRVRLARKAAREARKFVGERRKMEKSAKQIAKEALEQAKQEGLDEDDAYWMAVGAVNREAKKRGIITEDEVSSEMNAASQAVVKEVRKRG